MTLALLGLGKTTLVKRTCGVSRKSCFIAEKEHAGLATVCGGGAGESRRRVRQHCRGSTGGNPSERVRNTKAYAGGVGDSLHCLDIGTLLAPALDYAHDGAGEADAVGMRQRGRFKFARMLPQSVARAARAVTTTSFKQQEIMGMRGTRVSSKRSGGGGGCVRMEHNCV